MSRKAPRKDARCVEFFNGSVIFIILTFTENPAYLSFRRTNETTQNAGGCAAAPFAPAMRPPK
jgi:hypothetical protein